ncbi:MAG: peptide deformylase [Armatimonadetes bacterium]|nr:peptide deformylase [Armatimonadota bacterium]
MGTPSNWELKIVRYGHPVLRQKSEEVGRITSDVTDLVQHLVEVMRASHGVGLAANQVGVARRVAVVEVEGELTPLIDPQIVRATGSEVSDEGCLSLPRLYAAVARPAHVVVRARDMSGREREIEAEGLLARALCHEIDHLNGRLFVDSADDTTCYWVVGHSEEGEPITRPTGLEEALKVFMTAPGARGHG